MCRNLLFEDLSGITRTRDQNERHNTLVRKRIVSGKGFSVCIDENPASKSLWTSSKGKKLDYILFSPTGVKESTKREFKDSAADLNLEQRFSNFRFLRPNFQS
ncbi:hypothetical protein TNCV_2132281 [Trichonephila clavipes]|nr:hypothetical protein TNCV_2132281 [Trichonephila clavipes]